jgi:hypothetical protein
VSTAETKIRAHVAAVKTATAELERVLAQPAGERDDVILRHAKTLESAGCYIRRHRAEVA